MNEVKEDVILNNQLFDWLCKIMQEENSIDSVYWARENTRDGINEEMLMGLMNLYEFVVISAIRQEKVSTLNCTVGLIYQNSIYFLYYGAESFVCDKRELGCEIKNVYLISHKTIKKGYPSRKAAGRVKRRNTCQNIQKEQVP